MGKQDPGERANSRPTVNEAPCFPPGGPAVPAASNSKPIRPPRPQTMAGCVWDGINWSCAYDTVFMSVWSMYRKFPPSWRDMWMQQAPKWNGFFKKAFDSLLAMAQNEQTSQAALSHEFTAYRNTFRNLLSGVNPTLFKCLGMIPIAVYPVLSHIFSSSIESQPYLNQVVVCNACGGLTNVRCLFALLGSIELLSKYLDQGDTAPRLPLHTAVTRYVQHASLEPHRTHCSTCPGSVRVQSLSIPEMSWFWIELGTISPVSPSPHLFFDIQDQHRVYALQAVIYGDGSHFTARLSDQSATWWKYDGMWKRDMLRPDCVEDEVDLLMNDDRRAEYLLYCRVDIQD